MTALGACLAVFGFVALDAPITHFGTLCSPPKIHFVNSSLSFFDLFKVMFEALKSTELALSFYILISF